jgi:hypothetical protein
VQEQVRCAIEVGASTLGVAARVNLTFGCVIGDATLGDVGPTLGALGIFCGSGAGEKGGLLIGEVVVCLSVALGGGGRLLKWSACWPKCGRMEVWRSGSGNGAWLLPSTEEVMESRDCVELGIAGGGGSIGDVLEMALRL